MTTITPEIRQAIEQAGDAPVQITDPETHAAYIIVKAEVYERMRALCEDFDVRDFYPMMNEVAAREGWDDPAMDIYDEYQPPSTYLSKSQMTAIDECLKAALALP